MPSLAAPLKPGAVLVELGSALEVRYVDELDGGEKLLKFRAGTPCLWSPRARALVVPTSATKGKRRQLDTTPASFRGRVAEASAVFHKWTGHRREPTHTREVAVSVARPRRLGRVVAVAYRSDKFNQGTTTDYEHKCGARVELVEYGDTFVVRGGTFRLTPRGLEG